MRTRLLTAALLLCGVQLLSAQSYVFLDTNNVRALIPSSPLLFWNGGNNSFVVPKSGNASTIFSSSPWIGGMQNGNLYLAAETYRQSGADFQSGPISNSYATPEKWDVIRISAATINAFKNTPSQWSNPPVEIARWPAHGNVSEGQAAHLAPFVNVGGDPDRYEPASGDYPLIKGDQCTYYIFNDDMLHNTSGGTKLNVEIHRMVYSYSGPQSFLNNSVFAEYTIYNRSDATYDPMMFSNYTDFDLGFYNDDYIGTDSVLNMVYAYNGDDLDHNYDINPPAQGMILLDRKLSSGMYYRNDASTQGNPFQPEHYHNYMTGRWIDGTTLTYGDSGIAGASPAHFAYSGNACSQAGWTEFTAGNPPGDRRTLATIPEFSLAPGQSHKVSMAYLYARGTAGAKGSVCALYDEAKKLLDWYSLLNPVAEVKTKRDDEMLSVFPQPATGFIQLELKGSGKADIVITDIQGKMVNGITNVSGMIKTEQLKPGLYFVKATSRESYAVKKVLVQ